MQKENHKKNLSCRKDVMRHLRIFVSDGMVNGRKEIRRSRIETLRDDKPLLTKGNGFTLIELLVVVLIIGILATVALPQYQKVVEKSRTVQLFTLLKTLADAQETYYLVNGHYATDIEELPIDVPFKNVSNTTLTVSDNVTIILGGTFLQGRTKHVGMNFMLQHYVAAHGMSPNTITCFASNQDSLGLGVCKSMGGTVVNTGAGCAFTGGVCTVREIATR